MKKIVVINDLPSDVFSEHLSGNESFELTRKRFQDSYELDQPDIILLVNQKISLAVPLLERNPMARVAVVSGGSRDSFQPIITFVYGQNDQDDLCYNSWQEFDKLLLDKQPRPEKYLKFKASAFGSEIYEPNLAALNQQYWGDRQNAFGLFLDNTVSMSHKYLAWYGDWIREIEEKTFLLTVRPNKKTSRLAVSFINENRGLPIFNVGDSIRLLDKYKQPVIITKFVASDKPGGTEELIVKVSVYESDASGVVLSFSHPVVPDDLAYVKSICHDALMIAQKNAKMEAVLDRFCRRQINDSEPTSFLLDCASGKFRNEGHRISYPPEIALNNTTKKILRDPSQVVALLDILSDKPITEVLGPAGTGKTFVAATAVDNFVRRGFNVLVVSHSNLGADNLLLEIAKHVDNDFLFRLGKDKDAMAPEVRKFARLFTKSQSIRPNRYGNLNYHDRENHYGLVITSTIDNWILSKDASYFQPHVIFVDEASRGLFIEMLPLFKAAGIKIVFIGDNRQLGNIPLPRPLFNSLENHNSENVKSFDGGFFNALIENQFFPSVMLRQNRRSLPMISELVSQVFYQGQLLAGRFNPYDEGSVIFLDTKKIEGLLEKRDGTSWHNPFEVSVVAKRFISEAVKHIEKGGEIDDLVIITPYMSQVKLLKKKLRNHLLFHQAFAGIVNPKNIDDILDRAVITVDAIQGGQRKIVFVSMVRSNANQEIGFNSDIRRLNVAMSRAQEKLIIIGNSQTFVDCEHLDIAEAFSHILQITKKCGKYFVLK
ncbi:MAG: AAA domain-containing protein [Patescibacteria group bacterium]|jgi:RecA/RadA recombinase